VRLALTRLSSGAHRTAPGYALVGCGKKSFAAEETNPGAKPESFRPPYAALKRRSSTVVSAARYQQLEGLAGLSRTLENVGDRRGVSRRVFFGLAVMTVSSALFRHDVVFLQEHFAKPSRRNAPSGLTTGLGSRLSFPSSLRLASGDRGR
jgi:hypothetical protein